MKVSLQENAHPRAAGVQGPGDCRVFSLEIMSLSYVVDLVMPVGLVCLSCSS